MNEQIKQIAERLRGLRDVLDLTPEEVAESCQMSLEAYLEMESGSKDISVSALQQIARKYDVSLDVLMFGEEPKMSSYFLTRKGAGVSVERTKAYKYEALASGFRRRMADPFIVTVEPKPEGTPFQQKVWKLLLQIPYGKTCSYGELAKHLGCKSAQAVGGAVGRNPISILIPCHRVMGAAGNLTGYAGGVDKKEALLKLEKTIA